MTSLCSLGKPDAGKPPVRFDEGRELADSPRSAPAYSTVFELAAAIFRQFFATNAKRFYPGI